MIVGDGERGFQVEIYTWSHRSEKGKGLGVFEDGEILTQDTKSWGEEEASISDSGGCCTPLFSGVWTLFCPFIHSAAIHLVNLQFYRFSRAAMTLEERPRCPKASVALRPHLSWAVLICTCHSGHLT